MEVEKEGGWLQKCSPGADFLSRGGAGRDVGLPGWGTEQGGVPPRGVSSEATGHCSEEFLCNGWHLGLEREAVGSCLASQAAPLLRKGSVKAVALLQGAGTLQISPATGGYPLTQGLPRAWGFAG